MYLTYMKNNKDPYVTVKDVLKGHFHISDRLLIKLKKSKDILLNDDIAFPSHLIQKGDVISVCLDFKEDNKNIIPTKMDLDIIAEDNAYLIVNKPAGVAIHPSCQHYDTSLSNGIRYYFDQIGLAKKVRPVTRLDKDTSGLTIFAKNEYIQECLVKQMKYNHFKKKYFAILEGSLEYTSGTINAPIARKENSIIERHVSQNGEIAISHYQVIQTNHNISLVEYTLQTGRTHQLRVHSSYIGHPIIGDTLYGNKSSFINRQALHCYYLEFLHPLTQKKMIYQIPLPEDMKSIVNNYPPV